MTVAYYRVSSDNPNQPGTDAIEFEQALVNDGSAISFVAADSNAVERTVQDKLRDVVSVNDFGADPTGATDSTTAIQTAFSGSSKAISMVGSYKISSQLTSAVADRTILAYGATIIPTDDLGGTDYCISNSAAGFRLLGLRITGDSGVTLCGGVELTTGDSCLVEDCAFTDLDNGGAVVCTSGGSEHAIVNNYIDNCAPVVLGGSQYGAIHCNAAGSVISGNRIVNAIQTGISSANPVSLRITGNLIAGSNVAASGGIILDQAGTGCVVSGNEIRDVRVEGIQVANATSGTSSDHTISGNSIISTRAADDGPVSGITLYASGSGAVSRITISGNVIRTDDRGATSQVKGIDIDGATDCGIYGNTIEGGYVGIGYTHTSLGTNITGNTLTNQEATAISCSGGGRECLIQGNKISGDGSGGSTTGVTFNGAVGGGEQLICGNFITDCLVGISGTFSGTQRSFIESNFLENNGTNLSITSNAVNSVRGNCYNVARSGEATLSGGTIAVSCTALAATDRIRLSVKTPSTPGSIYVSARTDGSGFTITSTDGSDTSVIQWELDG